MAQTDPSTSRAPRTAADGELTGTGALVTGGTRGLGAAIARHLEAAGARVVVAARSRGDEPVTGTFVAADLATPDGPRDLAAAAVEELGGVDVLVDNAGGQHLSPEGALALTDEDWLADLSTNLLSVVRLDRELVPAMVARGGGVVVHIGSGSARLPQPQSLACSAAEAALTAYSKGLSIEVAPAGVRVNTVLPGVIETSATASHVAAAAERSGQEPDAVRQQMVEGFGVPTGRMGHPDDVAALVVFLASPRATYLTGSQFVVDGGLIPTT